MKRLWLLFFSVTLLASCSSDSEPVKKWQVAEQGLYSGSFNHNGENVVIASINHGASLWDSKKFQRLYNWNHVEGMFTPLLHTEFSGNGKFAVTAGNKDLVLWSVETGKAINYWSSPSDIVELRLNYAGDLALLGTKDNVAILFNIQTGGIIRRFTHLGPVISVAISEDGKTVVTGSQDRSVKIWRVSQNQPIHVIAHENQVRALALDSENNLLMSAASRQNAKIIELDSGETIQELNTKNSNIYRARFSDKGKRLLISTTARTVQLWAPIQNKKLRQWRLPLAGSNKFTSSFILDSIKIGNVYLSISSEGYLFLLR